MKFWLIVALVMVLKGQILGRVFNSRRGRACICDAIVQITETAKLKVENFAQTTFRLSPVSFQTSLQPQMSMTIKTKLYTHCHSEFFRLLK